MWYTQGPGGIPIPVAIGRHAPPEGQTAIDGVSWDAAVNAGVLTPDQSAGQAAVISAWDWFRKLP